MSTAAERPQASAEPGKNSELILKENAQVLFHFDKQRSERFTLSRRQREVAKLVASGLCDCEVAALLGISENTVGAYLKVVFKKYQVHSRAALSARMYAESISVEHSFGEATHECVYCAGPIEILKQAAVNSAARKRRDATIER